MVTDTIKSRVIGNNNRSKTVFNIIDIHQLLNFIRKDTRKAGNLHRVKI